MEIDTSYRTTDPLRQGDLIGFWDWQARAPLERFGLIITPDCDLARNRPDQQVAFLRIIPQADYLKSFWAKKKSQERMAQVCDAATNQVNKLRRAACPTTTIDLEQNAVFRWLCDDTFEAIQKELLLDDRTEAKKLQKKQEQILAIKNALAPPNSEFIECLAQVDECTIETIHKRARQELDSPPDELFFLTGFVNEDDQAGYYVLLDHMNSVTASAITNSMSNVRRGTHSAYRFGTLQEKFKYAAVQQFAFLFQRIGLPDDHKYRHAGALVRATA